VALAAALYVPAAQRAGALAPWAHQAPAGHAPHAVALAAAVNLPAGQGAAATVSGLLALVTV
jgi:hypothetical protein